MCLADIRGNEGPEAVPAIGGLFLTNLIMHTYAIAQLAASHSRQTVVDVLHFHQALCLGVQIHYIARLAFQKLHFTGGQAAYADLSDWVNNLDA